MTRPAETTRFLAAAGWSGAVRQPLTGDASARRYERVSRTAGTAILMDAPPDRNEPVTGFVHVARHLFMLGLSAPRILALDETGGFLLIEDLGDDLFACLLETAPEAEAALYHAAVDVLLALQSAPPPAGLDNPDAAQWAAQAGLAVEWYAGAISGEAPCSAPPNSAPPNSAPPYPASPYPASPNPASPYPASPNPAPLCARVADCLHTLADGPRVLVLRDYHAENLLWLPGREGLARVGLLDFQDAQMGQPEYDLVSLVQDARRDVTQATAAAVTTRFARSTGRTAERVAGACAALGAMRALRILGVFARLCLRDGKPRYLGLVPRVWGQLQANLAHPALARLAQECERILPPPTPENLRRIGEKCGQHPSP